MKKYFVVADVHGFFNEMMTALEEKGFDINNPDHIFVSLGDAFDRGKQPFEVLDFITDLPEDRRILILGNHELLMEQALSRGYFDYCDYANGTKGTAYQLTNASHDEEAMDLKHDPMWKYYIQSCVFYAEVGDNIFVHGWIPCGESSKWAGPIGYAYNPNWREASVSEWKEATWINGMKAWHFGAKEPGKTIWCGHWHTSWGHAHLHGYGVEFQDDGNDYKAFGIDPIKCFDPFKDDGIVAMDACTAYSHKVNCEVIEIEE